MDIRAADRGSASEFDCYSCERVLLWQVKLLLFAMTLPLLLNSDDDCHVLPVSSAVISDDLQAY